LKNIIIALLTELTEKKIIGWEQRNHTAKDVKTYTTSIRNEDVSVTVEYFDVIPINVIIELDGERIETSGSKITTELLNMVYTIKHNII